MSPVVSIAVSGDPPLAHLTRDADVPDDLWASLGRNIAQDTRLNSQDDAIAVPVQHLLAKRTWLAEVLTTYRCALAPSPELVQLLDRHASEKAEVEELLANGVDSIEFDGVLDGSRFTRELRPFQKRDLAHLLTISHGANFSVPGAGKTSVALATYEAERQRKGLERLLVVAPLSAFDAWQTESVECLDPPPKITSMDRRAPSSAEILLVNYQKLGGSRLEQITRWLAEKPCHLILDEAHRMKRGRNGEWGAACLDMSHLAVRRDILTGTPAPQHPTDFLALLDFLWPDQARRIMPPVALAPQPNVAAMHDVSKRLRPLFVRTRKSELGLRPPTLRVELTQMKPLQAEIYAALRSSLFRQSRMKRNDAAVLARMGRITMYLLEAASNPALLGKAIGQENAAATQWPLNPIPDGSTVADRIRAYSAHETPAKFDKLAAMVSENAGQDRKTLVWSNFTYNLSEFVDRVLRPFNPAMIRGDVPLTGDPTAGRTREEELRRFRFDDDCMVLVANPAAMSEGVSLHKACADAVYVDRTFNAGQYLQSIDRIHRLGLAETVETRITFLVCEGTIDETVDRRVRDKAERLSQMLDDQDLITMALPDEELGYSEVIDAEDLDALFGHLAGDGRSNEI